MAAKLTEEQKKINELEKANKSLTSSLEATQKKLDAQIAKSKKNIVVPPVIKAGSTKDNTTQKKSSKSVIVHQSSKPVENLYQALSKTEETITELTRIILETEDSNHKGLRGMPKLTPRQQIIQKQLDLATERADKILREIERLS